MVVRLRPHHILCTRIFTGSGYDKKFTETMRRVVDDCNVASRGISIVEGLDEICDACPHNDGFMCRKNPQLAAELDERVLSDLGLEYGGIYESISLFDKVEVAMRKGMFYEMCLRCEWFGSLCHRALLNTR